MKSPTPASFSAFWMLKSAGYVRFINDPLYDVKKGSFPTATYLPRKLNISFVPVGIRTRDLLVKSKLCCLLDFDVIVETGDVSSDPVFSSAVASHGFELVVRDRNHYFDA